MSSLPVIAAFDFDGTLTYKDSLLPFFSFSCGRCRTARALVQNLPVFLKYSLGKASRQKVKEALLTSLLAGQTLAEINQAGYHFSKDILPKLIRPSVLQKFHWHLQQGHRCILISANLDIYLTHWGKLNGFHDVICSNCDTKNGILTGQLKGLNCWGQQKVIRLLDLVGQKENFVLYAYGDSQGDAELLKLADHPFWSAE